MCPLSPRLQPIFQPDLLELYRSSAILGDIAASSAKETGRFHAVWFRPVIVQIGVPAKSGNFRVRVIRLRMTHYEPAVYHGHHV